MEIYIRDSKELFAKLSEKSEDIESKLGYKLDWQELPDKKGSRVIITQPGDFQDETQQDELITWLFSKAEEFTKVFKKLL
jgi:hypothetical protein